MLKYCLFFVMVFSWTFSFYWHFLDAMTPPLMIAYQGHDHYRDFKVFFDAHGVDLWVIRPHGRAARKNSLRIGQRPFKIFRLSSYSRMLLVNKVMPIPYHMDMSSVIEYKKGNETVASMWPRLRMWPTSYQPDALKWYRANGGHVVTIFM